jgi:tetratricopeptide (TPR) repeat protein
MRIFLVFLALVSAQSTAFAVTIVQHFSPQPRIDVPARFAGSDENMLKKYEVELARRLMLKPDDIYLSHKLGTILYHQGRIDEALRAWNSASEEEPNLAPAELMADFEEIFALLAKGDVASAQKKLAAAQKRHSASPHFHLIRGEQAMRSGNFEEAERAYRKAHILGRDLYTTSLNFARFYEFRQEHESARKYYLKAVELAPKRAECWTSLGTHQFQEGLAHAALKSFRRAKEADEDEPLAEVQLAKLNLYIRDYLGARRWYQAALAQDPAEKNAIRVALSDVQLRLGLLDEAHKEIEAVLKTEELVPLLVAMATIEESREKPKNAENYYRRALKIHPNNIIASNNLAMILVRMNRSPKEALKLAEKAISVKPNNAQILGTYSCALYQAGKYNKAKKALFQAVRVSPGDAWVRYFYGKLLLKEKQPVEGRFHLEGVLILDPEFPLKAEIQKILKTL